MKNKKILKGKGEKESRILALALTSLSFVIILILIPGVKAELGCCFDPSSGLCSENTEDTNCNINAEFSSSPSCSVTKCDKGCCVLGASTQLTTQRTCELLSRAYGYTQNFQMMDEASCTQLGESQDSGACLFGGDYEHNCKFTTREKCSSGDFHAGVLCSNSSLNTICNRTTRTTCYSEDGNKEDVHYLDSCGNPDLLKEDCDYSQGTICAKQKLSNEYSCKDLNCVVGNITKKNGESWCVGLLSEGGVGLTNITSKKWEKDTVPVGSRYFIQRCINGEITFEPCADFRNEICKDTKSNNQINSENQTSSTTDQRILAEAKCEKNDWMRCFDANTISEETGMIKVDGGSCGGNCRIFNGMEADCRVTGKGNFCSVGSSKWYPATADGKLPDRTKPLIIGDGTVVSSGIKSAYSSDNQKMYADLGLDICVPNVKGGIKFWGSDLSSTSSSSSSSICSLGNFETTIVFEYTRVGSFKTFFPIIPLFGIGKHKVYDWVLKVSKGTYDNAGLLNYDITNWKVTEGKLECTSNDPCDKAEAGEMLELNPIVIGYLEQRCRAISDCGGELNLVAKQSSVKGAGSLSGGGKSGDTREYSFTFKCISSKFGGNDCDKCGKDGLTCSEYRCKSLGNCDYFEPDGSDKGYCVSSSDNTAPAISLMNITPPSPIPPYSAVEFSIKTNEASECKFNLNNAGSKYSEMKYDFGTGFGFEHRVVLNLPGQTPQFDDATAYPILYGELRRDLNHTLYVRCVDPAGNGEAIEPFIINFKVKQIPDTIPPIITSFETKSGSAILYNTTEKRVRFKLNEPAECRWSEKDMKFENMINNFTCDDRLRLVLNDDDYSCTGDLTNITTNISLQTKFFIRCRDQPWIEGHETELYKRNSNDKSYEYVLRASSKLNITDFSPIGQIKKTGVNFTVDLKLTSSGGALNGKSECKFKIDNIENAANGSFFTKFLFTNASVHRQPLTNPYVGINYVQLRCVDDAGNIAHKNLSFNLIIDKSPPFINRIFFYLQNLKIKTDEESLCYVSLDKNINCGFDLNSANVTLMSGTEKEHTTEWKNDKNYYIKCKDYFGNYDSTCGKIIRTT